MTLTVVAISAAVQRAHAAMSGLEQELNAADARLGDGDTGGMLARVIGKMAKQDLSAVTDVGAAFGALARAAASATGSSLGTLLATALLAMSREAKGQETIPIGALPGLLTKARDAMMARGGAELGDKTILDPLDAVTCALAKVDDPSCAGAMVLGAAEQALEDFRMRPSKVGRARMFGDATVGLDDPGSLAFVRLTQAIVAE